MKKLTGYELSCGSKCFRTLEKARKAQRSEIKKSGEPVDIWIIQEGCHVDTIYCADNHERS